MSEHASFSSHSLQNMFLEAVNYQQAGYLTQAESIYKKILKQQPHHPDVLHLYGLLLHQKGAHKEAVRSMLKSLKKNSHNPECLNNLGIVYRELGKHDEAINTFKKAIRQNPGLADAYNNLGNLYQIEGRYEEAVNCYKKALEVNPALFLAIINLGVIYRLNGEYQRSREYTAKALEIEPGNDIALHNLGALNQIFGDFEAARKKYLEAIKSNPDCIDAYHGLVSLHQYENNEINIENFFKELLKQPEINEFEKSRIYFSLAKIMEGRKDYAGAFENYKLANTLRAKSTRYKPEVIEKQFQSIMDFFSNYTLDTQTCSGDPSELPVFVVGMPRSGTTLIEQIIASHPHAEGAGELDFFTTLTSELPGRLKTRQKYPECLHSISCEVIKKISAEYIALLQQTSESASRIVDKMPANFIHLGLIKIIFPEAKIIHSVRDPMDVCASIYFQNFASQLDYAYKLDHIAHYYKQYRLMMSFWKRSGIEIFDVQYEMLVNKQEKTSRDLISYIGLDWDPACLDFYTYQRAVNTASAWQARQPVYKNSIGRWEKYREQLNELHLEE